MLAIELVEDRRTRTPAPREIAAVFVRAREEGLKLSKSGPFRNVLRFVPPLCLDMRDVDAIADALDRSFAAL